MKLAKWSMMVSALVVGGLWADTVAAAENGQTHANLGYLDFLGGYLPPPGFYFRNDLGYYTSGSLNDRNGDRVKIAGVVPVSFQADAVFDIATLYYVTPLEVLGGRFATAVLVPFKYQKVTVSDALTGTNQSNITDFGDVIIAPQLGWHFPQWDLNITSGPTFYAPTGEYNRNNPVNNNIGHNFWTVEPQLNVTYLNATGQEFSTAFAYDFNFRNDATGYTSGQEFSVNYAIAQHLSEAWTLGIAGYYYRQLSDDTRNGNVVFGVADQLAGHPDLFNNGVGNRGKVFSIGPALSYNYQNKAILHFKWEHEAFAVNRQQGDQFWWRVTVPF